MTRSHARRPLLRYLCSLLLLTAFLAPATHVAVAAPVAVDGGIRFTFEGAAQSVTIAGEFNGWNATATPMKLENGVWSATVDLGPGTHEYKFVVDGQWVSDPENAATVGEFGNSAVSVGTGGELVALKATSNTPLSPKLLVTGRTIGRYISRENPDRGGRYELRRPLLDIDLDFDVRINDDLHAHVLTNIQNENEDVEFFQTRLNFDRGSLTLDNRDIYGKAWDNEGVVTFDDPLAIVGDVGIYDHEYGYDTIGAMARKELRGFDVQLLYADDSEPGGTGGPPSTLQFILEDVEVDDATFAFATARSFSYIFSDTDDNKDVLAARVTREVTEIGGHPVRLGVSARLDRGYNPGAVVLTETVAPDSATARVYSSAFERRFAAGGDIAFSPTGGLTLTAEVLRGEASVDARDGASFPLTLGASDDSPELTLVGDGVPISDESLDLDASTRLHFGAALDDGPLGLDLGLGFERETHDLEALATDARRSLESSASILSASLGKSVASAPLTGRPFEASLTLEAHDFSYDAGAPWNTQLWFDRRNFWLENGEHDVKYERLTLLGGDDAAIIKPRARARVWDRYDVDLEYAGTFAKAGIGKRPEYVESLLRVTGMLNPRWRAYLDMRIASFDDPVLEIDDRWTSVFAEIAYVPAPDISIAFSYGVDPFAIDEPVNEFAYIGRDLFLFERGANGATAETNYGGMGPIIAAAEEALAEERRFQIEAIVGF